MSTGILILTLLAIIFAAIQIWAEYRGSYRNIHIFKPLVMICIVLVAIFGQTTTPLYKILIITGLLCSMAGDTLLMPPWDRFVAGLIAFLVAHLFYIAAFTLRITTGVWWSLIPLLIYGIILYVFLVPSLNQMKVPVLAYIIVILTMAWLGWTYWLQTGSTSALLAFAGAILFVISDSILAINRFRIQFKTSRLLNLTTYFLAQWFIAGSVGAVTFNTF